MGLVCRRNMPLLAETRGCFLHGIISILNGLNPTREVDLVVFEEVAELKEVSIPAAPWEGLNHAPLLEDSIAPVST